MKRREIIEAYIVSLVSIHDDLVYIDAAVRHLRHYDCHVDLFSLPTMMMIFWVQQYLWVSLLSMSFLFSWL